MRSLLTLAAMLAAVSTVHAQESHWIANRRTNDLHEIDPGGTVLRTATLGTNLRSAHLAPDGKVWVVRFIQSTIDIFDPATGTTQTASHRSGSAYSIAFDAAGHAWVSGGTGVDEFDANGNHLATYPLTVAAPLGITVDNLGNKWIAHRDRSSPSVSRIDGTTGTITNHLITASTTMQPVEVVADYRGFTTGLPSHIWVIGDGSGDIAEFDEQGNFLNLYASGSGSLSGITTDFDGDIWTLNSSGVLTEFDQAGNVLTTYGLSVTQALALGIDYLGRLWVTDRVTFSCPTGGCPPCLVWRVDPATGVIEVPAEAGIGTQSKLSTLFHHAVIVDPLGDLDGDNVPNVIEVQNGTSPVDPQSRTIGVRTLGSSQLGSTLTVDVVSSGPSTSSALFSTTTTAPTTVPGVQGDLLIGLPAPAALPVVANAWSVPLSIPNDPSLAGVSLYLQGVVLTGPAGLELANRTSFRMW